MANLEQIGGKILKRTGQSLVRVNVRDFSNNITPQIPTDGITVRLATLDECLRAARDPTMQMKIDFVETAFDQAAMCHAAFAEDKMVAYAWRATKTAPHNDIVGVKISNDASYGFKAYTHEDYRGLGIYSAVTHAEYETCRDLGVKLGVSFTDVGNIASIRADKKLGNRCVGIAAILRFGSTVRCFNSAAAIAAGFRFVPLSTCPDWPW